MLRANQAILRLCGLAYNMLNALRSVLFHAQGFDEPRWSMRRLRERVLRVAARVSLHARRVTIVVTEAAARYRRLIWLHWHLPDAPAAAH